MLVSLAFAGAILAQQQTALPKSGADLNKIYLQSERALGVAYSGEATAAQALSLNQLKPLALAASDLDGDGVEDLVVGYTGVKGGALVIHRGNLDAFAPQSEASWQAVAVGRFPSPFLSGAKAIVLPEPPDCLALG